MSDAFRPPSLKPDPNTLLPIGLGLWQRWRSHKPDLHELERAMHTAERGDLSHKLPTASPSGLAAAFNKMCGSLSSRIAQIRNHSSILAMAGGELAHGIQDLAARTEQQAQALGTAAQAVGKLNGDLQANAQLARRAQDVSTQVHGDAEAGEQLMNEAMAQVRKIELSAKEMSDIIAVIDSIAFQTNILALNAAVEAARAGEQGRGFAVVASEVRMLAQRSAESAAQVKQLIAQSGDHVEHGVQAIGRVGQALGRIVNGIRELNEQVSTIAAAGDSQCAELSHIADAVNDANDLAQRNADMVQDSARAARESEVRTRQLSDAVQGIRLSQGTADEARHLVDQACALIDRVGLESAIPRFMAKEGGFLDRDMYLFIFNRQGTLFAFAPNPSLVGGHLRQIQGLQWEKLLHDGFIAVEEGGGWVEYDTVHPVTGTVLHKVSYVRGLPGDRMIGCGVYKV